MSQYIRYPAAGPTLPLSIANGGTGLSSGGSANQVLGMDSTGTNLEYKSVVGTTNQVTVSNAANLITLALPQSIATSSTPVFGGLTSPTLLGSTSASGTLTLTATSNATKGQILGTDPIVVSRNSVKAALWIESQGLLTNNGNACVRIGDLTSSTAGFGLGMNGTTEIIVGVGGSAHNAGFGIDSSGSTRIFEGTGANQALYFNVDNSMDFGRGGAARDIYIKGTYVYGYTKVTATDGGTATIANHKYATLLNFAIANPVGYTVTFPSTPIDGQEVCIGTNSPITTLTLTGNGFTIFGPNTIAAFTNGQRWIYVSGDGWYPA